MLSKLRPIMNSRDNHSVSGEMSSSVGTDNNTPDISETRNASKNSSNNYCDNYFDIKDILSLSQRVSATFLDCMPRLGFLDPSAECEDISSGTKLELPLWLAKELHSDGFIAINVPKGYNQTYREILEADANCVNLHKLSPNYYQFGQHLSHMSLDESEDIAKSLVETFHQRYHRLVNYSLSATNDTISDVLSFESQLDNKEKDLFCVGKESLEQMKNWENRSIEKVTANDMVINLRKRKRLIMEDNSSCTQSTSSST